MLNSLNLIFFNTQIRWKNSSSRFSCEMLMLLVPTFGISSCVLLKKIML